MMSLALCPGCTPNCSLIQGWEASFRSAASLLLLLLPSGPMVVKQATHRCTRQDDRLANRQDSRLTGRTAGQSVISTHLSKGVSQEAD